MLLVPMHERTNERRCRVDARSSRTKNYVVTLQVIGSSLLSLPLPPSFISFLFPTALLLCSALLPPRALAFSSKTMLQPSHALPITEYLSLFAVRPQSSCISASAAGNPNREIEVCFASLATTSFFPFCLVFCLHQIIMVDHDVPWSARCMHALSPSSISSCLTSVTDDARVNVASHPLRLSFA